MRNVSSSGNRTTDVLDLETGEFRTQESPIPKPPVPRLGKKCTTPSGFELGSPVTGVLRATNRATDTSQPFFVIFDPGGENFGT